MLDMNREEVVSVAATSVESCCSDHHVHHHHHHHHMFRKSFKKSGRFKKALRSGVSSVVRGLSSTMGANQSSSDGSLRKSKRWSGKTSSLSAQSNLPPLHFHNHCGSNIRLESDGVVARRVDSFCKGIVFTSRPVYVGERVHIRIASVSARWSGVLRLGFTAHDPARLGPLPKYACPDLTSQRGFWAKAVPERFASRVDAVLHFYVSASGAVHLGLNDEKDDVVFFTGVDTRQPLWALIDLYGNCTAIELRGPRTGLVQNPYSENNTNSHIVDNVVFNEGNEGNVQLLRAVQRQMSTMTLNPSSMSSMPARGRQQQGAQQHEQQEEQQSNWQYRARNFHFSTGKNVKLSNDQRMATRLDEEFAQAYVFTGRPVVLGERFVVRVTRTDDSYVGSMAFGLTNCDPNQIDTTALPEDSDQLLDRPEYWVTSKDVANSPALYDELSFLVRVDGAVELSKNGCQPSVIMHVDSSLRLWAFFDLYGRTAQIQLLGATVEPLPHSQPLNGQLATSSDDGVLQGHVINNGVGVECTVCFERAVDCALYTCGHMCMCHGCAVRQWKTRGAGFCPICREPIRDVIRIFRA